MSNDRRPKSAIVANLADLDACRASTSASEIAQERARQFCMMTSSCRSRDETLCRSSPGVPRADDSLNG